MNIQLHDITMCADAYAIITEHQRSMPSTQAEANCRPCNRKKAAK